MLKVLNEVSPLPNHSRHVLLHFKTSPLGKVDLFSPQNINSLSKVVWDSLNNHTLFSKSSHGRQSSNCWALHGHTAVLVDKLVSSMLSAISCSGMARAQDGDIIFCRFHPVKCMLPFWHFVLEQVQQSMLWAGGYGMC